MLDLAREAAHAVARPAAPLTTFLAGYALGAEGGLDRLAALVFDVSAAARAHGEPGPGHDGAKGEAGAGAEAEAADGPGPRAGDGG